MVQLHAALEVTGAKPHERDTIPVVGVHVGWTLNTKADTELVRGSTGPCGGLRARGRREARDDAQELVHREVAQRAAEDDGGEMALSVGFAVEGRIAFARELGPRGKRVRTCSGTMASRAGSSMPVICLTLSQGPPARREEYRTRRWPDRSSRGSRSPCHRPDLRRDAELERLLDLVITSKALRPSRSTLLAKVMMGMSRRRQISKSLRVWLSMPLATSTTMMALSTAVSVR